MSVKHRIARLEAQQVAESPRQQVPFLWCSDVDNPAMAAAEARAWAEGKDFMVIKLVAAELDANGRVIDRGH